MISYVQVVVFPPGSTCWRFVNRSLDWSVSSNLSLVLRCSVVPSHQTEIDQMRRPTPIQRRKLQSTRNRTAKDH
uniref:Secreted protein n=1 Tax=Heterorhabditis bacteriophora TaxID=37862 RepID=A0A1I7XV87_HETBA